MVTLNSAHKALRDARTSIRDLSSARDLEEAERHWKRFLDALIKIEKKVHVAVSDLPRGEGWFGQWQGQRKTELLSYCLHARNCDGHRIEEITAPEALVRI